MDYIIMCGGKYNEFEIPKHLTKINGERLVDRTIRLLKENGVENIYISSNDKRFDNVGVPRLEHFNDYEYNNGKIKGYWLNAFYPIKKPSVYIFGDVYFSENAIKTIVNYKTKGNILFGTGIAKNKFHENWGEPFAYIVNDYKDFFNGIEQVKRLWDKGKLKRHPIVWELYRYLNNLNVNKQYISDRTYVCIDDETMDIDSQKEVEELKEKLGGETNAICK